MRKIFLVALLSTASVLSAQENCLSHTLAQRWLLAHGQHATVGSTLAHLPMGQRAGGNLTIPVVVHVVWNTSAENVSGTVIANVLAKMNADFQALNSDWDEVRPAFASDRANPAITFCLATQDPGGNPTTGITRTQTTETWFDPDTETDNMKSAPDGIDGWDPDRYLNIWICDISSGATGGLVTAGFAYPPFPGIVGTEIDGLVLDYTYGVSASARTATHEVGHYLGLEHPWSDGGCGSDDGMDDTPTTDGPTYDCSNTTLVRCGELTQYENFMDYSDCRVMFTSDQSARMGDILTGIRASLLTSDGCESTSTEEPCEPASEFGTGAGDYIDGVALASITNIGSGGNPGPSYTDYSTVFSTQLDRGATYGIEITSGEYEADNFAAWIDLNNDNTFSSSELLGSFSTDAPFQTGTLVFTVPASTPLGIHRLRVRGTDILKGEPAVGTDACFAYTYGETEDYGVEIMPAGTGPCIPISVTGTFGGDFVDGVVLEGIDNTGTGGTGMPTYRDYSDQTAILLRGNTYTLEVTSGDYDEDIVGAWIDFDHDGDFETAELIGEAMTASTFDIVPFAFTVPNNALIGMGRMRVRCVFPNTDEGEPTTADPCVNYSWGETEDYAIIVQSSTGVPEVAAGQQLVIAQRDDEVRITWPRPGTQQELLLMDASGRLLGTLRPQGGLAALPTGGLSAGIYQVMLLVDGERTTGRFLVAPMR